MSNTPVNKITTYKANPVATSNAAPITEKAKASALANTEKAKVEPEPELKRFQQYKSARVAMNTITDAGVKIKFTGYEYITDREDEIEWLDNQILTKGLPGITKGEALDSADRDPMAALRARHYEEFQAELDKKLTEAALGRKQNMGTTLNAPTIKPANSENVAN